MAIQRVSGNILQDNLQRGANLSIQGNLAYFDVVDNRVGINTSTPLQDLSIAGNLGVGNYIVVDAEVISSAGNIVLLPTGNVSVSNVYIQDVLDPIQAQDAATKNYVDTSLSSFLTFEDDGANTTSISAGDTVFFNGTANEVSVVVSSLAVTFGLPDDVIVGNSLSVTGNFDAANIYTGGNIIAIGNIEGGNIISEGAVIGNIQITGNITVNNITVLGNTTSNNASIGNILTVGGNITGGNLISNAGIYGTTANVTGNVSVGNLTITSTAANRVLYTDANKNITTTANFTFDGSQLVLTGTANVSSNVFVGNLYSAALINAVGNITGSNVIANGNVNGNYVNVTKDIYAGGNAIIDGNLTINGDLIYENVTTLAVEDPIISLGRGANNTPLVSNDGKDRGEQLWYYSGAEKSAFIGYDNSAGNLIAAVDVTIANEIVTVNQYGTWQVGNIYAQTALITGNVSFGNISTPGQISATGNITGGNLISNAMVSAATTVNATGNVTGGNLVSNAAISAATTISATGNITGGNLISNANISASSAIFATGNITGGNLVSNANISAANAVFATGNITGGNLISNAGIFGTTATITGNIIAGNVSTLGVINVTGNITGGNLISNANISATNAVFATGNVTAGNLVSNASISAATTITAVGNITGGNLVSNANISATTAVFATGNITGGNLVSNANISAASFIFATANIVGGNLISNARIVGNTLDIYGDALVAGNLTVQGNLTYINIDDLRVEDPIIQLGGGANGNALVTNDGKDRGTLLTYYTTGPGNAFVGWDNSSGNMIIASNVSIANEIVTVNAYGTFQAGNIYAESAVITGNTSFGNISTPGQISATGNITGGNLISNANISAASFVFATANIVGGNLVSNANISATNAVFATGNITGGNLVSNASISAATTISATGNITGGNLVSNAAISAATTINATGNITGGNLVSNASISAATTISATGNITGGNIVSNALVSGANVQISTLTPNRVVYVGTDDYLVDSANFTFNGSNANLQGQLIVDNFTIDGTAITSNANISIASSVNGNIAITPNGSGNVVIDNISISDNTIYSTAGNIVLDPTANIVLPDELANSVLYLTAGKEIQTAANFTFDGANLVLLGRANIDNVTIDGTTISSNANLSITASSGNLLLTPGTTGVTQISSTTALTVPVGNTAQRPATPDQGAVRFNSSTLVLEVWDGTQWDVVGQDLAIITSQTINGDGTTVAFTLNEDTTSGGILVSINGVSQIPDVSYGVVGNIITFTEAPQVSDAVEVRFLTQIQTVTEITNTVGNSIVAVAANVSQVNITGNLLPTANVIYSLGNTSLRWKDLYLAGNSIYLGNVIITNATGNTVSFFAADGVTPATISSGGGLNIGTGNLSVGNIFNNNANGVGNIGSSTTYFNTVFAKATSAQYADLAEYFESDQEYDTGTVMIFGGSKEVTRSVEYADQRLAGIVSTDPAFVMNATQPNSLPIAMAGRVPCWVIGPVSKGDVLTTSGVPGHAVKLFNDHWKPGVIVGKSLESCPEGHHKIMVVVGAW